MWASLLSGCNEHGDESMASEVDAAIKERLLLSTEEGGKGKEKKEGSVKRRSEANIFGAAPISTKRTRFARS